MSLALDRTGWKPEIELAPDAEPMDLFYLVMRNNSLSLSTRMRAARGSRISSTRRSRRSR
jgi:hypothetical protein